ncbi:MULTISPECIES: hypothetical protein [unclassified Nocardia]|uniref:hypothetical protein n=1 Tax=unclassified Nocardia TaxID=2637762 RepID=UPI00278C4362|nr:MULTISPECIES: hypothetical protein [unclassified Nocardia]
MRYSTALMVMVAIAPGLLGYSVIADPPEIGREPVSTSTVAATTTRAHTVRELCDPVRDLLAGLGAVGLRVEQSTWPLDSELLDRPGTDVMCHVESDSGLSGFISLKRASDSVEGVDLTYLYPESGYSAPVRLRDKRPMGRLSVSTFINCWTGQLDIRHQEGSMDRPTMRELKMSDDQVTAAVELVVGVTRGLNE